MRRSFIRISIVWVALLSVLLWSGPATGKKLESIADFSLKDIKDMEGEDVTLSGFEGKVVLLNVFTTT